MAAEQPMVRALAARADRAPRGLMCRASAASATNGGAATTLLSTSAGDHAHDRAAAARRTVATNAGAARIGAGDASVVPGARTECAGCDRSAAYVPP